ncbi:MAG: ABC transporter permease [Gemmatimonadetes bacterium]|nr:MAG: ABC transporter permease [Gemmatimonadota bacterium]
MAKFRGLIRIVWRSLRQHALSTLVTTFSVALAAGLVMAVFSLQTQTYRAFTGGNFGFDAVLGARGSPLQLVLNAVFHLETSPGNIPWRLFQQMQRDPRVELAIPYAVGDHYKGFRIVGTTDVLFTDFEYQQGKKYELKHGRFFDSTRQEAVLGSFAAQKTGLKVGDTFHPTHGLGTGGHDHDEDYVVTGILKPTNTPSDRVIWIPIEGVFRMAGHVLRGSGEVYQPVRGQPIPDAHKEVSVVMLKLRDPQGGFFLDQEINKQGNMATLAYPIGRVMADLFEKLGWIHRVLTIVAYLVVLVAAGSILASIYNTISERRQQFAILRALGARRRTLFTVIILESTLIGVWGSLVGFGFYLLIVGVAGIVIRAQTGVVLHLFLPQWIFLLAPLGIILLSALAGVLPALRAYATDVAQHLS